MEEIWKDIQGFEGIYQISNMGRIRSLDRYNARGHWIKGRMIKPAINKGRGGYLELTLHNGQINITREVHRLVALHFVPGYREGLVVNHINEIKTDNRAENLEFCTRRYNMLYSDVPAYVRKPILQCDDEWNVIARFHSITSASEKFGVTMNAISNCLRGITPHAAGFKWKYAE